MYLITIDNNYVYCFEKFQEIVSYVKQEIRKHLNKSCSSHKTSYDEWFFTDDVTIYDCNPEEIDEAYKNEHENLDVYGVRMYEKQNNIIFYYENTVKVIHVTYIPRFEAHKFIDLPTNVDSSEDESDEEDDETESEDENEDEDNDETESEEEDETESKIEEVEKECSDERKRTDSEKNIEKEESEFTTIN